MRDVNVFLDSLHSALALGPVAQDHLLQARQMQALSFAVHIPLVCFGIAFPVMVLLMEWWGQRTGDPLYRTIARRWSRVMIALFAIGVITGTVLSFERGVLWPTSPRRSDGAAAEPGDGRTPTPRLRPARAGRLATACLIGGLGFLTIAEAGWAHAIGVTMLLAALVLGLAAAAPALLEDNESDGSSRSRAP